MSQDKIGPDHYRYYATLDEEGVHVQCERFVVIGETECCYYVIKESLAHMAGIDWSNASPWRKKLRKRVLKASYGRRYCYPDKRKALHSFQKRQKWRISHANRNLAIAELSLKAIEKIVDSDHPVPEAIHAGQNDYTRSLSWDLC